MSVSSSSIFAILRTPAVECVLGQHSQGIFEPGWLPKSDAPTKTSPGPEMKKAGHTGRPQNSISSLEAATVIAHPVNHRSVGLRFSLPGPTSS